MGWPRGWRWLGAGTHSGWVCRWVRCGIHSWVRQGFAVGQAVGLVAGCIVGWAVWLAVELAVGLAVGLGLWYVALGSPDTKRCLGVHHYLSALDEIAARVIPRPDSHLY